MERYKNYTITLQLLDGRKYPIPIAVPYGEKGDKGDKGDTGAAGKDGTNGTNGKDGTSVIVSSVSTSAADGGSNVVTFSDGKTLTVKNGSKGSPGADGKNGADGKTPVKGTDYFTSADKTEMVNAVIAALPKYTGEVADI